MVVHTLRLATPNAPVTAPGSRYGRAGDHRGTAALSGNSGQSLAQRFEWQARALRHPRDVTTGGTIYGMSVKTTLYLPVELKAEVEREARRRGIAEAEVIRLALAAGLARPRAQAGILEGP